jgi:hypothetical protein
MDDRALQRSLQLLFERHDVELEVDEDWLLTEGDFPAVRASWHAGESGAPGRLDIDVVLSEERRVEQSYAGYGTGETACRDALERFAQGDLHVLLAACWYVTDDRRLDLASWHIGVRSWDVFLGTPTVEGAEVALPDELAAAMARAVQDEMLTAQLHWVGWLLRHAPDGTVAVEALLDNEPWPAGDRVLTSVSWPPSPQAYSARGFLMLDVRDY